MLFVLQVFGRLSVFHSFVKNMLVVKLLGIFLMIYLI